jgi:hypothetical protein
MINNESPSEKFNMPVIGRIYAELPNLSPVGVTDSFEVIDIIDKGSHKIYVCNQWNSYDVPQLVSSICVVRYEEK